MCTACWHVCLSLANLHVGIRKRCGWINEPESHASSAGMKAAEFRMNHCHRISIEECACVWSTSSTCVQWCMPTWVLWLPPAIRAEKMAALPHSPHSPASFVTVSASGITSSTWPKRCLHQASEPSVRRACSVATKVHLLCTELRLWRLACYTHCARNLVTMAGNHGG